MPKTKTAPKSPAPKRAKKLPATGVSAPWGVKADGTPKAKPGRKPKTP